MVAFWVGLGHCRERFAALAALQIGKVEAQQIGRPSERVYNAGTSKSAKRVAASAEEVQKLAPQARRYLAQFCQ